MGNREKYDRVFLTCFQVNEKDLAGLNYQGVHQWDSIGHMNMIAELEETFNITIEMDDILNFSSYVKGLEIILKYGVEL